jgi:signal peptidase II
MQKQHHPPDKWRDAVFAAVALIVVLADQLSKWWIRANLVVGQTLWDAGFFQIIHVQNTGVAFGFFKDHTSIIIVLVFIEIIVLLLVVFFLRNRLAFLDGWLLRIGLGLITGGAIGNQIDRLRLGHVTDFLDFKVWPAFNAADASAVVGCIIIVFAIIFLTKWAGRGQ